jgi:hypothetical protein
MVENLNVYKFRNGDSIPETKSDKQRYEAGKNKKLAMCFMGNEKKMERNMVDCSIGML